MIIFLKILLVFCVSSIALGGLISYESWRYPVCRQCGDNLHTKRSLAGVNCSIHGEQTV
jgi:hypothetical protein